MFRSSSRRKCTELPGSASEPEFSEGRGQGFESLRVRHLFKDLGFLVPWSDVTLVPEGLVDHPSIPPPVSCAPASRTLGPLVVQLSATYKWSSG